MQLLTFSILSALCVCDTYLHAPRGSNNRLNENSANRNNGNRLFDSQNNNRGGYNVGQLNENGGLNNQANRIGTLEYTEGSILPVEWTNQHACGTGQGKNDCQMILQYTCDQQTNNVLTSTIQNNKPMRDGTNTNQPNTNNDNDNNRGRHETQAYYQACNNRERNKGLWTADQDLNGNSATRTRQNPNGNRNGLECAEERDYYPYWHPTPFKDIAVLTDDTTKCAAIQAESQNVKGKNYCTDTSKNNANTCTGNNRQFLTEPAWGIPPPDCLQAPWTRQNHLGNTVTGQMSGYNWTLPSVQDACNNPAGCRCVLRLRYNMSSMDVPAGTDASSNGDQNVKDGAPSPVQDNPLVDIGAGRNGVRLALNTNQVGRTFQDRTHIFVIKPKPAQVAAGQRVFNIGVRGKRCNTVQCYPAVEYDFTPNRLHIKAGDWVHFQWTGSNTHNNGNPAGDGQAGSAGRGKNGSDRHNVVQIPSESANYPTPANKMDWGVTQSLTHAAGELALQLATSGKGATVDPLLNNASPTFDGGLMQMGKVGQLNYMSTRNNKFGDRQQKGAIIVGV